MWLVFITKINCILNVKGRQALQTDRQTECFVISEGNCKEKSFIFYCVAVQINCRSMISDADKEL
jgi:hypothetical protein